jgi:sacsin
MDKGSDCKMSKQKDYIEELRRRRFGIGLDDIPESLINYVEDREKEQQDVARLASEIHSRAADCILELLQNADDNEYGENVLPEVIFILKKDLLIMQNNEKGFTKENVDAICRERHRI